MRISSRFLRILAVALPAAGFSVIDDGGARVHAAQAANVWDGVYTEQQSARGLALYKTNCSSCHADSLMGDGFAPALVGDTFMSGWNGLTVGDLFERTRISMPQDKPGTLTRAQVADITAYLLQSNMFPTGAKELDQNDQVLKGIKIDAQKPGAK